MAWAGKRWTAVGSKVVDAHRLWQAREPRTLSDAYRRFVGPLPADLHAHDARDDVSMTMSILNAMRQGKTVAELHDEAHPGMVDPAGKFRQEAGEIRYNFGPYRGLPVSENPDYLSWMLTKSFAPSTVRIAAELLDQLLPDAFPEFEDEDEPEGF